MNKNGKTLPRRAFLTTTAAAAASILAIETVATPRSGELTNNSENAASQALAITNDPVFTESVQTLTNKTIPSRENTLGTDYVNVKEFNPNGNDITDALNDAISYLGTNSGGQILIPHGIWITRGGHEITSLISIEGVGCLTDPAFGGTRLNLMSTREGDAADYMFIIKEHRRNISIRNLEINLTLGLDLEKDAHQSDAIGLLVTDVGVSGGTNLKFLSLENISFVSGGYGIKIESSSTTQFECILNRFERVQFLFNKTGFFCNTVNGGYNFDTCYFRMPHGEGYSDPTCLHLERMGNISLNHCQFEGSSPAEPHVVPLDNSLILRTKYEFNSITFYDCQDENVQNFYKNNTSTIANVVPLVFRNCLIQSSLRFSTNGSVVFDACRINVTNKDLTPPTDADKGVRVHDTSSAVVKIYIKGETNLYWFAPTSVTTIENFTNPASRIFLESFEVRTPVISTGPLPLVTDFYVINSSRGIVYIKSGGSYIQVWNNLVNADSMVFAQLLSYDPNASLIRAVQCYAAGYFVIALNGYAGADLKVAFRVEV